MPGYATWKVLYQEEYKQLREEGYDVSDLQNGFMDESYLPLPREQLCNTSEDEISERQWKIAYENLWKETEKGIRKDYPFIEPNDFNEITKYTELPEYEKLQEAEYESRIKGAWFGRCAGVVLGKPLEMGYDSREVREYLESVNAYPLNDWVPSESQKLGITLREDCIWSTKGNVAFVQPDDDIQYTIMALMLVESKGTDFSKLDVGFNWLDNVPYHWFWCSSRQMYYHLVNSSERSPSEQEISDMVLKMNPWRECLDGQIRGDFWGYINPADPVNAARLAHRECEFGLVKNGLYGAMFVAGCIAGALSENPSVSKILDCGMGVIPPTSRLYKALSDVRRWYEESSHWEPVCARIEEVYGHLPFAGTINNLCMVVLAILHGNLDYHISITTAVMCGIDTDCNAGTVGSIVGAAVGYMGIDSRWIKPLNDTVRTVIAGHRQGSITELAERTVAVHRKLAVDLW